MSDKAVVELMLFDSVKKRFDLLNQNDLKDAYKFIEHDCDYKITYIGLDWAVIDSHTSLDDIVEVLTVIQNFAPYEMKLFEIICKERIEAPIDTAISIKDKKYTDDLEVDSEEVRLTVNIAGKTHALVY
ncbi:hypothetical protein [Macrococcus armenti]|uniref:hypothetical protein n=1 Tax=Macrococcus armenti TaxID=2875764 RepID=UPI001CCFBE36|nr:hypothetical protein [Macrococcus armenti]UBH16601.1 hypothetical protein LAU44_12195 [Macrococcus armenti]UBH21235.1 hypothetical protein LAU40_12230 [Macrococcus armenti]